MATKKTTPAPTLATRIDDFGHILPRTFDPTYDRARWIADLRSGDFKQGNGFMLDSEGGMCCLGVAGYRSGLPMKGRNSTNSLTEAQEQFAVAPAETVPDRNNALALMKNLGINWEMGSKLADRNDFGATFAQIADTLENDPAFRLPTPD